MPFILVKVCCVFVSHLRLNVVNAICLLQNLASLGTTQMNYGGEHPGAYGAHPGGGYYGGQPPQHSGGSYPGGASPEVQQWFNAVDRDRSGKITAKELQAALVNGQGKNFSDQACSLMIGKFQFCEKTCSHPLDVKS